MGQSLDKSAAPNNVVQHAIHATITQDGYQVKVNLPTENSRFLKTYICSHDNKPGTFLVKLFVNSSQIKLAEHEKEIKGNYLNTKLLYFCQNIHSFSPPIKII